MSGYRTARISDANAEQFLIADVKDLDGILTNIDVELAKFGLELVVGDSGDDNIWVRIQSKTTKVKA